VFLDDEDGPVNATLRTISVTVRDGDGGEATRQQAVTVNNVAPTAAVSGADTVAEAAPYALAVGAVVDPGADTRTGYRIDWGDGAVQDLTPAQWSAAAGSFTHAYADGEAVRTVVVSATDEDGPVNATARTIRVTVRDGDGGEATGQQAVTVNNVAPTIPLGGAPTAQIGVAYALSFAGVVDPGDDVVSQYAIDWGDGTVETYTAAEWAALGGSAEHTFLSTGSRTVSVTLVDEDGSWADAGALSVSVGPAVVRIGDAPTRITTGNPNAWVEAWTDPSIAALVHKADASDANEAWSNVKLDGLGSTTLAGGDIAAGDLGVSGVSLPTSTVRQEIDGREALRIELDGSANEVSLGLSRFFINDDGSLFVESGRIRLLDADGNVVGESVFNADSAGGTRTVTVSSDTSFTAIEISAGVDDGNAFVFGGYADDDGSFGSAPYTDSNGRMHGSDFMLDWVEFRFDSLNDG
jgi:hypothetical protein